MSNDDPLTAGSGMPEILTVPGQAPGPVLALLGGVHGDELEGVLAARRIVRYLRQTPFRGTLRVAAPAHPAAWAVGTRTSPRDGRNLAREFPGDPAGAPTQRAAAHLTAHLIDGADLLVDLHSAGKGFDMALLAGYSEGSGELSRRARAAVEAFAAPVLWEHPAVSPGRSLSAAAALGVPSLYVEGRGGGQVRQDDLDTYVAGVLRVLEHLGMLDDAPPPAAEPVWVTGDGDTDGGVQAAVSGYLVTAVDVGDHVGAGEPLGQVVDADGQTLATVPSPQDGIVMLLRRNAEVDPGDTLAIVAAPADGRRRP